MANATANAAAKAAVTQFATPPPVIESQQRWLLAESAP